MTSQNFKTIFTKEFNRQKWIPILLFSITFIIYMIFKLLEIGSGYKSYSHPAFIVMPTIFSIPYIATSIFGYMHNKSKVDLIHSLPISRKQLFLMNYLKGILYFTIPYFVMFALTFTIDFFTFGTEVLTIDFPLIVLQFYLVTLFIYTVFVLSNIITGLNIFAVLGGIFLLIAPFAIDITWYYNYFYNNDVLIFSAFSYNEFIGQMLFMYKPYISITTYFINYIALVIHIIIATFLSYKLYITRKSENTAMVVAIDYLNLPLKVFLTSATSCLFIYIVKEITYGNSFIILIVLFIIILTCFTFIYDAIISMGLKNLKIKSYIKTLTLSSIFVVSFFILPYPSQFFIDTVEDIDIFVIEEHLLNKENIYYIVDDKATINTLFDFYSTYNDNNYNDANKHISISFYINGEFHYLRDMYLNETSYNIFNENLSSSNYYTSVEVINYLAEKELLYFDTIYSSKFDSQSYITTYPFETYLDLLYDDANTAILKDINENYTNKNEGLTELPLVYVYTYTPYHIETPITKDFTNTIEFLNTEEIFFDLYEIDTDMMQNFYFPKYSEEINPYDYNVYRVDYTYGNFTDYYISEFTAKDIIDGNIKLELYNGEVNEDSVKKHNLKIVVDPLYYYLYYVKILD